MNKLKLYYIDDKYIEYLRKFDKKVAYNKDKTRPYVGIVYTYNNLNYFAPLSSPKEKHRLISDKAVDVFRIKDGELGIINLNNMIPTPIETLTEVLPTIKNIQYKNMLIEQLDCINKNYELLKSKVETFQKRYRKNFLSQKVLDRCCNFSLLEEKCKEYNKDKERNVEDIDIEDDFDDIDV